MVERPENILAPALQIYPDPIISAAVGDEEIPLEGIARCRNQTQARRFDVCAEARHVFLARG